jgi:pantoate--beta-alanine ligase
MQTIGTASELRAQISAWRREGARIALVPTMGNLHAGHYSLITLARAQAERVVASIFVNPTQFGPSEDFGRYPRTLDEDRAGLIEHGCDLLFAPKLEEIYPYGAGATTRVEVPIVSEPLEGALRPGHFVGVATVVTKLFNLVRPDVAVFGRKDYQQLLVIERMVRDLCLPIRILAAPIVRESNGLAMSSRNRYLSAEARQHAGTIHAILLELRDALRGGQSIASIEESAQARLQAAGFAVDYAALRRADDLREPASGDPQQGLIALIAARLGGTRLIDNLAC